MKFSYPSTFIIPCSIFDIGLHAKNIKNNLALMGLHPPLYTFGLSGLTLNFLYNKIMPYAAAFNSVVARRALPLRISTTIRLVHSPMPGTARHLSVRHSGARRGFPDSCVYRVRD